MNTDSELQSALQESVAGVHLDAPLDQTIRRGRRLRARRRMAGIAGLACIAAISGGALTAIELAPGGADQPADAQGQGTTAPHDRLTAWTVTRGPGGTVTVLVRELGDPAGLQRALRADGVPAHVAFQGGTLSDDPPLPRACANVGLSDVANAQLQGKIIAPSRHGGMRTIALTINAAAIPKNIGLNLTVQLYAHSWGWSLGLVQRTPQCTGS
jgi:hypothetical protein